MRTDLRARIALIVLGVAAVGALAMWYLGRAGSERPARVEPAGDTRADAPRASSAEPAAPSPAPAAEPPLAEPSSAAHPSDERSLHGSAPRPPSPARSSHGTATTAASGTTANASATVSPPPAPTTGPSLDDVERAIQRRDGKACRAALAALTSPPATDYRVASLRAICEMVAGNCEGGTQLQRELYRRDGTPESSADNMADLYCPLTDDPAVRLHRLSKQLAIETRPDCDYYLGPARAAADEASTDLERRAVGSILSTLATCFSHRGDCTTARAVLAEAQAFIPQLALNELNAQCR